MAELKTLKYLGAPPMSPLYGVPRPRRAKTATRPLSFALPVHEKKGARV